MVAVAVARWTLQDLVFIKGVGKGKTLGLERGGTWRRKESPILIFRGPSSSNGSISIALGPILGPPDFPSHVNGNTSNEGLF